MSINIYASLVGQTSTEREAQVRVKESVSEGQVGYICEAHEGFPYATAYLLAEVFVTGKADISASVMVERLPLALRLAEVRVRTIYGGDATAVAKVQDSFRAFVELCERMEKQTGRPVTVTVAEQ